ncbi:hypothetical protein [Cerasicoccus maritimus]|uniref:hypothetical protein n=1 Tax=Cerasicoccus maritimus TaxID=490089 RepID=UPI002852B4C1|nr:hypothetical protein [Cerasicoccus maritimus]
MNVFSDRTGPLQYFRFFGIVVVILPYGNFPDYWIISILLSSIALLAFLKFVKRIEVQIRNENQTKPNGEQVALGLAFAALMLGNALIVQSL